MAPLIPDGIFKIHNAQYPEYVADLIDGVPGGPISAYKDSHLHTHDKWHLKNVGSGGNQVTLESISVPGNYATVHQQIQGAKLVGSAHPPIIWTVVKVDGGRYYLQSPDGNLVWELPKGENYVNIILVHHTGQENTKWSFQWH